MTADDVELVRESFDRLASEGFEALLPFIDPDFEVTVPADLSLEPATYRGPAGFRRYFESFYETMEEVRFEPDDFIAVGGAVVVPVRLVVRGRGSGVEAMQRLVQVWRLRDGRAIRVEPYATLEEALAALEGR
jgi:ketosteroid isomerase-like protein